MMKSCLPVLCLLCALLAGCAGTVNLDGEIGAFGPGTSAAQVELKMSGDTFHFFLLTNQANLCPKLQQSYERAATAINDFSDLADEDECRAFAEGLSEAWDPLVAGNAHFAATNIYSGSFLDFLGGLDELTEPEDGTFEIDDGEATLQLAYFGAGSPYAEAAEELTDCDFDGFAADLDDAVETVAAEDGEVSLSESESGAWRVDFEVELIDEGGDSAGTGTGGFGASHCEVDVSSVGSGYLFVPHVFLPWVRP